MNLRARLAATALAMRGRWWVELLLPVICVGGLFTLVVLAAVHERAARYVMLEEQATSHREQLARRMERILDTHIRSLQVLALTLQQFASDQDREAVFRSSAQVMNSTRLLQWLGADGRCRLAYHHADKLDPSAPDQRPGDFDALWAMARQSALLPVAASTPPAFVSHGFIQKDHAGRPDTSVEVLVPMRLDLPSGPQAQTTPPRSRGFAGAVAGQISITRLLRTIANDADSNRYQVTVLGPGGVLFQSEKPTIDTLPGNLNTVEEPIRIDNTVWRIRVIPKPATRDAELGSGPGRVFWGGTLLTLLVAGGFLQARAFRRRELRRARSYADAVEQLHSLSVAIGTKLGSSDDVLSQLAAASAHLIGVHRVRISLLSYTADGQPNLRCIASYGWPGGANLDFPLAQLPNSQLALATQQPVVINDAPHATRISSKAKEYNTQSLMLVPILVEGRNIGMISLCDTRRDFFTEERQRLGRLWAAQAAVVLANTQLHQQAQCALHLQQQLMSQREQLSTITSKIYAEKTLQGTIDRIVQLSPGMLGVDFCSVLLRPEGAEESRLILMAATPPLDSIGIGSDIRIRPAFLREIYDQKRVRFTADASEDAEVAPQYAKLLQQGSVLTLPIYQSDQQPLGLLLWIRRFPGTFRPEQVELAQVFASRAAVALENARLHQQTLQDAQAKAMLLRELNHRVKNNLAGIVGLLNATVMTIGEESRPAVARLAHRVQVMARAHELFVGGVSEIPVAMLIEQVLSSVSVIRGTVKVKVFCHAVDAHLRTDRAVTLAMVLHELAYNAVVHGCEPDGHLQVHARCVDHLLTIELVDSGVLEPSPSPAPQTGIGLELVRGLVRRELHGSFRLERDRDGGSRAVVEIPLQACETSEPRYQEVQR